MASSLEGALGETLARLRPHPAMLGVIEDDWDRPEFMDIGAVAASWREVRIAVQATLDLEVVLDPGSAFLDVEAIETHQVLRRELGPRILELGHTDLDVGLVRGADRRVTRDISQWAYRQVDSKTGLSRFAGVRYCSRLNSTWECWAIFEDVPLAEVSRQAITLRMPELDCVATAFGLRIF